MVKSDQEVRPDETPREGRVLGRNEEKIEWNEDEQARIGWGLYRQATDTLNWKPSGLGLNEG